MEAEAASRIGTRVLGEIEESNLDEVLASLRISLAQPWDSSDDTGSAYPQGSSNAGQISAAGAGGPKEYPFPPLNDLVSRHFRATQSPLLALTGRCLPLIYSHVAALVAAPRFMAVLVVDVDSRFDATRLLEPAATNTSPAYLPPPRPSDLDHVHVVRPPRGSLQDIALVVADAQRFLLYGVHGSRSREWWGTIVIDGGFSSSYALRSAAAAAGSGLAGRGGGGHSSRADVDVNTGRRGWLHVKRAEVRSFRGVSAAEALADRANRQEALDNAGWMASSVWGGFTFGGRSEGDTPKV